MLFRSVAVNRAEVELDIIEEAAAHVPLVVTTPEDAETVRTAARSREMLTAIANTSDYGVAARARELLARLFGSPAARAIVASRLNSTTDTTPAPGPHTARSLETPPRGAMGVPGVPVA